MGAGAPRRRPLSRSSARAAATPATTLLTRLGVAFALHSFEHDPAATSYGLAAATALGVPPELVLKTLLVTGQQGLAVGIVPVHRALDLKAMAAALGAKKVALAEPAEAERATGYVLGGISPFGQRRRLPTVLDESATAHERVYVSAGRRGLDLSLEPHDLVAVTQAVVARIAR